MCAKAKVRRSLGIQPLLLIVALVTSWLWPTASASVSAQSASELTWQMEMDLPASSSALASGASLAQAKTQLADVLAAKLPGADTSRSIDEITLDGQPGFRVTLQGKADDATLRKMLFSGLSPELDVLGGPLDIAITGHVQSGQSLTVSLESRPSTGYGWQVAPESAALVASAGGFATRQKGQSLGAPAVATVVLQAAADGDGTVRLVYRRPWEAQATATRRLSLQTAAWPASLDLTSPVLPPSEVAASSDFQNSPPLAAQDGLPTSWDWRSQGKVTSIRNQGSCGSCWAFATVGVLESAILIGGGASTDLSEQFLVSCNNYGYSCNGGWWDAHDYHTNQLAQLQSQIGAVMETDMPYQGTNGTCQAIASHPYHLASWSYIASGSTTPAVDQIKTAIYNYGPVGASICAGSGFQGYTGGVFSTDDSASCSPSMTNHAIILVGWDDNGGNGYWILRNSWGTNWGESGYMRIKWGTSHVGYAANYVTYTSTSPDYKYHVDLPFVMQASGASQSVRNGDFESGAVAWTEYSTHGYSIITQSSSTPVSAHSGNWLVWLGGEDSDTSYVQQQVTVPASAPYLSYWRWIASQETACSYDYGGVLVNGSVAESYGLCQSSNTGGWQKHVLNLGAYAGQTVTLQIRAETDASINSNLFIDDVGFQSIVTASENSLPPAYVPGQPDTQPKSAFMDTLAKSAGQVTVNPLLHR